MQFQWSVSSRATDILRDPGQPSRDNLNPYLPTYFKILPTENIAYILGTHVGTIVMTVPEHFANKVSLIMGDIDYRNEREPVAFVPSKTESNIGNAEERKIVAA